MADNLIPHFVSGLHNLRHRVFSEVFVLDLSNGVMYLGVKNRLFTLDFFKPELVKRIGKRFDAEFDALLNSSEL